MESEKGKSKDKDSMPQSLFQEFYQQCVEKEAEMMKAPSLEESVDLKHDMMDGIMQQVQNSKPINELPSSNMNANAFRHNEKEVHNNVSEFVSNSEPSQNGSVDDLIDNEPIEEDDFISGEVQDLVFLGKITSEVKIAGNVVLLRTLNGLDNINIVDEVSKFTNEETKRVAGVVSNLVRAIQMLNGRKLYAENPSEFRTAAFRTIHDAKNWLLNMQQATLNYLWEEYVKILNKQREVFGEVKNL